MMASQFVRKFNYSTVIEQVRRFCLLFGKEILPIPNEDSIICYYQGKPIVTISETAWELFGKGYDKHFSDQSVIAELRSCAKLPIQQMESAYGKYKEQILSALDKGLYRDKERYSAQYIAQKTMCNYGNDGFHLCGMETAIPTGVLDGFKSKPEIDLVAIHPQKRQLLLIEYKCTKGALLNKTSANIRKHCEDYHKICLWIQKDKKCEFIRGMLNAYKVMCALNDVKYPEGLDEKDFTVNVLFLLTNKPCEEKCNPLKREALTKQCYRNAKSLLIGVDGADDSYYLAFDKPEVIVNIPSDIICDKYRGLKALEWEAVIC